MSVGVGSYPNAINISRTIISLTLAQSLSKICGVKTTDAKRVPWIWDETLHLAFTHLKHTVTNDPVLKYYDVTDKVTLRCDASETGLSCAYLQQ